MALASSDKVIEDTHEAVHFSQEKVASAPMSDVSEPLSSSPEMAGTAPLTRARAHAVVPIPRSSSAQNIKSKPIRSILKSRSVADIGRKKVHFPDEGSKKLPLTSRIFSMREKRAERAKARQNARARAIAEELKNVKKIRDEKKKAEVKKKKRKKKKTKTEVGVIGAKPGSSRFVWDENRIVEVPDERYARERMLSADKKERLQRFKKVDPLEAQKRARARARQYALQQGRRTNSNPTVMRKAGGSPSHSRRVSPAVTPRSRSPPMRRVSSTGSLLTRRKTLPPNTRVRATRKPVKTTKAVEHAKVVRVNKKKKKKVKTKKRATAPVRVLPPPPPSPPPLDMEENPFLPNEHPEDVPAPPSPPVTPPPPNAGADLDVDVQGFSILPSPAKTPCRPSALEEEANDTSESKRRVSLSLSSNSASSIVSLSSLYGSGHLQELKEEKGEEDETPGRPLFERPPVVVPLKNVKEKEQETSVWVKETGFNLFEPPVPYNAPVIEDEEEEESLNHAAALNESFTMITPTLAVKMDKKTKEVRYVIIDPSCPIKETTHLVDRVPSAKTELF